MSDKTNHQIIEVDILGMERERLTITLRRDILKLVDQSIDGAKLRNRSHAIEYFLSRELSPKAVRVVLLVEDGVKKYRAAGMPVGVSSRMGEDGSQNLKGIFQNLANQNFKDVLLIGSDSTRVSAAAVDAENMELNVKTEIVDAQNGTLTAESLASLENVLRDETFIWWDTKFSGNLNLSEFLDYHKNSQSTATAAVTTNKEAGSPLNLSAHVYGKTITDFGEKVRGSGLPVAGVFACEPTVLNNLSEKSLQFYEEVLPKLAKEGTLAAFVFTADEKVAERAQALAR